MLLRLLRRAHGVATAANTALYTYASSKWDHVPTAGGCLVSVTARAQASGLFPVLLQLAGRPRRKSPLFVLFSCFSPLKLDLSEKCTQYMHAKHAKKAPIFGQYLMPRGTQKHNQHSFLPGTNRTRAQGYFDGLCLHVQQAATPRFFEGHYQSKRRGDHS